MFCRGFFRSSATAPDTTTVSHARDESRFLGHAVRMKTPFILAAVSMIAFVLESSASVRLAHSGAVDSESCHRDSTSKQRHCHQATRDFSESQPPRPGDEGVFFGPVVSVIDGDSFSARIQGVVMEFRLADIDAPESDQPYGDKSTQLLTSLLQSRDVVLVYRDVDSYGRIVVQVWLDAQNVNREVVRRGAAWFNARYALDDAVFNSEHEARAAMRGLWALPLADRIEPWEWRRRRQKR
jgi:endonuclease YncB( thermonuclease family)